MKTTFEIESVSPWSNINDECDQYIKINNNKLLIKSLSQQKKSFSYRDEMSRQEKRNCTIVRFYIILEKGMLGEGSCMSQEL